MRIEPLGDRVVIEAITQEETTVSGIILPESAKEKPQEGRVIASGSGVLKEGDHIIFSKYAGTEVRFGGRELLIMRESDIMAVLRADLP